MTEKDVLICDTCGKLSMTLTPGKPWLRVIHQLVVHPEGFTDIHTRHFCSSACASKYFGSWGL